MWPSQAKLQRASGKMTEKVEAKEPRTGQNRGVQGEQPRRPRHRHPGWEGCCSGPSIPTTLHPPHSHASSLQGHEPAFWGPKPGGTKRPFERNIVARSPGRRGINRVTHSKEGLGLRSVDSGGNRGGGVPLTREVPIATAASRVTGQDEGQGPNMARSLRPQVNPWEEAGKIGWQREEDVDSGEEEGVPRRFCLNGQGHTLTCRPPAAQGPGPHSGRGTAAMTHIHSPPPTLPLGQSCA